MTGPSLKTQITDEMKAAMKSGDKVRLGALRMFLAAIKTREVEGATARELSDDEIRLVAAKERAEREVLEPYAPPQVDEAAIDALVDEAIAATGATSVKEMGTVMGAVMSRAKALGQVDGAVVQAKVRAKLGG